MPGMPSSDISEPEKRPLLSGFGLAAIGFGLLFLTALVLWSGFGGLIFVDLASVIRSCF